MSTSPTILVHPRCGRCQSTFCRRVRSDEACTECGAVSWAEKHEPAFELVRPRADGWYGVQDYENVHPGDQLELLVAGDWRSGKVVRLGEFGFYVAGVAGGLEIEYRSFDSEGVLWRWETGCERGWIGPFCSRETAETVRHDWAPGYLVCGVCGWDGWKTKMPAHYAERQPPAPAVGARPATPRRRGRRGHRAAPTFP